MKINFNLSFNMLLLTAKVAKTLGGRNPPMLLVLLAYKRTILKVKLNFTSKV